MARGSFERRIRLLKDEVIILGSMVEEAVQLAVHALIRQDTALAKQIYQNDQVINEKRFAIENAVLIQMATQQPMARDLRALAAILEVIHELERMGDYGKGIARVTLLLEDARIAIPAVELTEMMKAGVQMLHRGLSAFVDDDVTGARQVALDDKTIDGLYTEIYGKIVNGMILDPGSIENANLLLWVAHNLERLGDRVVNICERTIFTCTGDLFELDSEDENQAVL